ncbi:hypothetical protein HH214_01410 [Mucilaginibacter robiniae]|uniref:Uncharacterized protein n=1 Tax=Mucilaginibacter robiniae TaxID=2728022 RepID=A0A7L5DV80_9SPHI|nr:hypothetical protein [Mucilaginibacter robiniae]QJD94621.1 hypothetical protein HH214_01410 [Mucilaginibacter robiniae]
MIIDVTLTNLLFKILSDLNIDNPAGLLKNLVVKKGVLIVKIDTASNPKKLVDAIDSYFKSNYQSFKVNLTIAGKTYKLRYPSFKDRLLQTPFMMQLSMPFYWAILVSCLPLLTTAFCLKFSDISITDLDHEAKEISNYYVNICFLLSTLIITYLITKVVAIKQEKNNRIVAIRDYSNQLTEFRRICRNLIYDPSLFTAPNFARYARGITSKITFQELENFNSSNDEDLHLKVKNYIVDSNFSEILLKLYLQLHSFYIEGGYNPPFMLATHSANYIYSSKELKMWELFTENNLIWYVFDNERGNYENHFDFSNQAHAKPVVSSAKRFDRKKYKDAKYSSDLLLDISMDVQNEVLPNLTTLVKKNEEGLPFVFKYFIFCFAIIVLFGVVVKNFFDLFYPTPFIDLLSIMVTMMVLIHIFVSLKFILRGELYMSRKTDYL